MASLKIRIVFICFNARPFTLFCRLADYPVFWSNGAPAFKLSTNQNAQYIKAGGKFGKPMLSSASKNPDNLLLIKSAKKWSRL